MCLLLPVEYVEESVQAECGYVVAGDVLDEADLVEHDDLGDEGDRLQPQRVAPYELPRVPTAVHHQGQHQRCW